MRARPSLNPSSPESNRSLPHPPSTKASGTVGIDQAQVEAGLHLRHGPPRRQQKSQCRAREVPSVGVPVRGLRGLRPQAQRYRARSAVVRCTGAGRYAILLRSSVVARVTADARPRACIRPALRLSRTTTRASVRPKYCAIEHEDIGAHLVVDVAADGDHALVIEMHRRSTDLPRIAGTGTSSPGRRNRPGG